MLHDKDDNQNIANTTRLFASLFGNTSGAVLTVSPASIILLGDHTHYNDGILISASIDRYWTFMIKKRKDYEINIASTESNKITNISLDKLDEESDNTYKMIRGLLKILKEENLIRFGFDCVVSSSVPDCIGLGSSAAHQVGFLNSLRKLFAIKIDDEKLLSFVRKNELNLIGKISNIAHHYTVQFAKKDKLFFIDLRTKEYKTISWTSGEHSLVICDSGKEIIEPQNICNERIEECEVGVKALRLYLWGIKNLRDIKVDFLYKHYHMLPKRIFDRVLYNVKERTRAQEAIKHLRKKSIINFGNTIVESHNNLAEDYELSNEHCDFLSKESQQIEGVYCSKIICCSPVRSTFHFVDQSKLDEYSVSIKKSFKNHFQNELKIYSVKLSGGVKHFPLKELEFSMQ
ncbi:MAG: galactokinase [Melioribacteraceae bacterium]